MRQFSIKQRPCAAYDRIFAVVITTSVPLQPCSAGITISSLGYQGLEKTDSCNDLNQGLPGTKVCSSVSIALQEGSMVPRGCYEVVRRGRERVAFPPLYFYNLFHSAMSFYQQNILASFASSLAFNSIAIRQLNWTTASILEMEAKKRTQRCQLLFLGLLPMKGRARSSTQVFYFPGHYLRCCTRFQDRTLLRFPT